MQEPIKKVAISRAKIGGEVPIIVNEVTDKCLYSGFFGTLDSARIQTITEKILGLLGKTGIEIIIIDLANVDIIDSAVIVHITKFANTLKLVGVDVIFCGITPIIAQTMITVGIELKGCRVSRDLKSAIKEVFLRQGLMLVPFSPSPAEQAQQQQQQQQQQQ